MSQPNDPTGPHPPGLLAGVRILDVSGPHGAYGGRLLADLGADVVRVERDGSITGSDAGVALPAANGGRANSFERFTGLNTRSATASDATIQALAGAADVLLTDGALDLPDLPTAVHRIDVSPFGRIGRGRDLAGDDLIALAAGGLLSLGGYPDTEPIAVYGSQAYLIGGIFTALAALLALLAGDHDGSAHRIDVSIQAGIAGALEDATAEADLAGTTRQRSGDQPREAGTGTYRCQDGYIAIVAGKMGTAHAWANLVQWLRDAGTEGAAKMTEPGWDSLAGRRRPEAIALFRDVFERFTRQHTKAWLYEQGQHRGIAIAPVNTVTDLGNDPQLTAREYFQTLADPLLGTDVTYPGPPFRLHGYPTAPWRSAPVPGADTDTVCADWLPAHNERFRADVYRSVIT